MPTPKKGARLGGSPAHQKLILANLATQLIENRAITTTEAKAKLLQPYFEKLVTKAKRGDIHARRTVAKKITSKEAVYLLFDEIAPAIDPERQGGYTRLIRVGNRKGDNAPLMRIEIVLEKLEKKLVVKAAETTAAKAAKKAEEVKEAEEAAAVEAEETEVEAAEAVEAEAEETAADEAEATEAE